MFVSCCMSECRLVEEKGVSLNQLAGQKLMLKNLVRTWETPQKLCESEGVVTQSCPTLCDPMDCSLPSSSVHGILQVRKLEWVAISFPRGYSWPRDSTLISYIAGGFFTPEPPGKPIPTRDMVLTRESVMGRNLVLSAVGWGIVTSVGRLLLFLVGISSLWRL